MFDHTFGFTSEERARGIVSIEDVRRMVEANAGSIPVTELVGYLEIGGPKLARDYSDWQLEDSLRESFRYLRETWCTD
jgi:hypothetical protein